MDDAIILAGTALTALAALITSLSRWYIDRRTSATEARHSDAEVAALYAQMRHELMAEMRQRLDDEQAARRALEQQINQYGEYTQYLYRLITQHAPAVAVQSFDEYHSSKKDGDGDDRNRGRRFWPGF